MMHTDWPLLAYSTCPQAEDIVAQRAAADQLTEAIEAIIEHTLSNPVHKIVVRLAWFDDCSIAHIAEITGESETFIEDLLTRVRRKIMTTVAGLEG